MCHSSSLAPCSWPSFWWAPWSPCAAVDASDPSRNCLQQVPQAAGPLVDAYWKPSPWWQTPPGAPHLDSPAQPRPPARLRRLLRPAMPRPLSWGPRPPAASLLMPASSSTCPPTSLFSTASRPLKSCLTRGSSCTRNTSALPTPCPLPRPFWTPTREDTGPSSLPVLPPLLDPS